MEMADRTMSVAGYRYGFNGKEKDPSGEWGSQAIYDYGFRIYNPGLGKFLSVDPLTDGYPELTPYQFAGNMPISNIDLDGLENLYYTIKFEEDGTSKLKLINRWDGLACNCNGLNVHLVANGKAYRIAGNLYGDRYGKAAKVLDEYRALTEDQLNNRIASMESVGEKREREAKEKQDLIEEYAMAGRGRGMIRSQSKPKPPKTTISKPKVGIGSTNKEQLKPTNINFSQRTVSGNVEKYVADMKAGKWDWSKSGPIRIMKMDGKWVSYDNRRLMAAQRAGLDNIPYKVVKSNDIMPGSKKTWSQAFQKRFNDQRNIEAGGAVPNGGLSSQPIIKK